MSLVERELPTFPEHLNLSPVLSGVRVLCVAFCRSMGCFFLSFCPFSFVHSVWAVPLRFTDSDFPFGIFKYLFSEMYDSAVGIKGYINNKSLSHSINTINKS